MATTLPSLIDKQDTYEIVRDQIAVILYQNQLAQVALAVGEPDPSLWKLRVYRERSNPIEGFKEQTDLSPIVNVWYASGSFDGNRGNVVANQLHAATYNLDVYGAAISKADPNVAGGHLPGDREAAFAAQRGVRLVRNILMAAENTYLQLRGVVWKRWVQSITFFQPEQGGEPSLHVIGMRLSFSVEFNEYAPQVEAADVLEEVAIDIKRTIDDMVIAQVEYDLTP